MTSIRKIQTERLLQDVVHSLYSQGQQPLMIEVTSKLAQYFSKYPAGSPLPAPISDAIAAGASSVEEYNKLLQNLAINLDVLYEASLKQVEEVVLMTSFMQSQLERLKKKRARIETTIDDYLLSQYNTDGYFYSVSDNFSDLELSDLTITSAQVDTTAGVVMLPTISRGTTKITSESTRTPTIRAYVDGVESQFKNLTAFTGALEDSLTNVVWAVEVETDKPREVVVTVDLGLGRKDPVSLSRVDVTPHGVTPVQIFMETTSETSGNLEGFGRKIQTSDSKMIFTDSSRDVTAIRFTLRKTQHDYTQLVGGNLVYRYIIGARDISMVHQVYERNATFVSKALSLPTDYEHGIVIDAVSLDVFEDIPADTELHYYIAGSDVDQQSALSDYVWREIVPVTSRAPGSKIVRFDGAAVQSRMIRDNPKAGEMQLIPERNTGPVEDRNPTPTIIPGVDVYRIAEIDDKAPLPNSVSLFEGVNTTQIYSQNMDESILFDDVDLDYWADVFDTPSKFNEVTIDYGRIDAGNEFFYGGDVGAAGKDIFVETYVDCPRSFEVFLAEFQKVDPRSRTWDIKIYLNGRSIGRLPVGTSKSQLPWNLRQGLNHIVLLVRIPIEAQEEYPFLGSASLMGSRPPLYDYGPVYLSKWSYVDFFTMQFNQTGRPRTFTIHDNHIISRRKPTTNLKMDYALDTGKGPEAVRLRVDMSRSRNSPNISPKLDEYRLRFSYGGGGDIADA